MINRRSTRFRYVNRWKCLANKASSVRLKNHWPTKQVHVEPESRYFFFPIVPRSLHLILRIAGYHLSLLIFLPTRILSLAFNTGIMKRAHLRRSEKRYRARHSSRETGFAKKFEFALLSVSLSRGDRNRPTLVSPNSPIRPLFEPVRYFCIQRFASFPSIVPLKLVIVKVSLNQV